MKEKKDETKNADFLNELENAEKSAAEKPKATKEARVTFYADLKARLNAILVWLMAESGVRDGENASRVSLILKGASRQTGRIAKIESGRLIVTLAPLNDHGGTGKHYRPSVPYTPTTDVEKALVTLILNDALVRAAFIKVYQKASVYMTPETRAAVKRAISA